MRNGASRRDARRVRSKKSRCALSRRQRVTVYRLDDDHRPHLIDRRIEQHEQQVERDDGRRERYGAPDDGVQGPDGRQRHERIQRQPDEEPEIDLIEPVPQKLVVYLMGQRARRLLQRDQQQGNRDRRDRDEAGRYRAQQIGGRRGIGEDPGLKDVAHGREPREGTAVEHERARGEQHEYRDETRGDEKELGERAAYRVACLARMVGMSAG